MPFKAVPSPDIYFPEWKELVLICERLAREHADLAGSSSCTARPRWRRRPIFLSLTLKVSLPVVVVGSQRPASSLSTDAGMNLANAIRTAASPEARGMGVMVLLNDEIHSAREVTKTSTFRLQTFRSPDFGVLGHADGDAIVFYRKPIRRFIPRRNSISEPSKACRAWISSTPIRVGRHRDPRLRCGGCEGPHLAGFAPGFAGKADFEVMKEAVKQGVVVMQSTRAGSGRTFKGKRLREGGVLITDNLNPQKARCCSRSR